LEIERMTALAAYGLLTTGAAIGFLTAALLAGRGDCERCARSGPIVRRAYDVADGWTDGNVPLYDALEALADECAHQTAASR